MRVYEDENVINIIMNHRQAADIINTLTRYYNLDEDFIPDGVVFEELLTMLEYTSASDGNE